MTPDRILTVEIFLGEDLVNYRRDRSAIEVALVEWPAGYDGDLHGFEKGRANQRVGGIRAALALWRLRDAGHGDAGAARPAADQRHIAAGGAAHTGNRLEA